MQRFGRYHPDYKEVTRKTRAYKREVDMDQNVAAFRRAEMDLQSLLDEISLLLASAVSENIKVPTGNPFLKQNLLVLQVDVAAGRLRLFSVKLILKEGA